MAKICMETPRLWLRPWTEDDAAALYKYARDPAVGPIAGWPPHQSVENSREVIRDILSAPETYAVVLKETGEPVGSVGIMFGDGVHSADMREGDAEIGYWIGVPYWGKGLIPEAVNRLLQRCFDELGLARVWCGYYDGNTRSRRVMDKCGFKFHHTEEGKISPLGDTRTEHFTLLTRSDWASTSESGMANVAGYTIRPLHRDEIPLLREFLYQAIFIPPGVTPPPRDVIDLPELSVYIEDFGTRQDDHCLVASLEREVVGALWARIMPDYGHVDNETPSLSMSLLPSHRGKGIGTRLMTEMLALLAAEGYSRVSLSVQRANYAVNLYLKQGFNIIKTKGEEYIMVKELHKRNAGEGCSPAYRLRALTMEDAPEMRALFHSTVLHVNIRDYSPEEVEDWASCGDDLEHWEDLLLKNSFIAALDGEGRIIGFSSMNPDGYLHSMFVHEDWQGKGVATLLLAAVEKMAQEFGVPEITSEVSLTARPFFERKGYEVVKSQKRRANKLELRNFEMRKRL